MRWHSIMQDVTGQELRQKREAAGVRAADVAVYFDRHGAFITRLEQQPEVDEVTGRRYLRAVAAVRPLRTAVKRQLLRELAAL
jgi:hypothetical protein